MRVMLVDDEQLALKHLGQMLVNIGGVEIIAMCTDAHDAIVKAVYLMPDVVFIDIHMPEIDGLEAAERIQATAPDINIVFVTAYDDYAIRAFDLNALDYLLKPLATDRLKKTLSRILERSKLEPTQTVKNDHTIIRCFLHLQIDDVNLSWRTTKAQELFAYLVHHRNQPVRKDYLIELLWPDIDTKKGYTILYSTIYQVRKTLTELQLNIVVESTSSGYLLKMEDTRLDVDVWEQALNDAPSLSHDTLQKHMDIFELYIGNYLADHDFMWAESERERLRAIWHQHAIKLSDFLEKTSQYDQAINVNIRILAIFPFSEEAYWHLMQLYYSQGDRTAVKRCYHQLTTMLFEELGTQPKERIMTWIRGVGLD